jgi:Polyketide cyclase / dehydrase and lipid transport
MRALKTIGIILLALVVIVLGMAAFGKNDFRIERSAVIQAPPSAVYANVNSLAGMDTWGPWKEMEHNMTSVLSGSPDGQVGAISHWKSDESEGEMELGELVQDKRVITKLRFISPWTATNEATYDLEPTTDGTKVTWAMTGQNNYMAKVMGVFMNMDKMVGPMFEKGLANLKTLTEKEHAEAMAKAPEHPAMEIMSGDRPTAMYIGLKSDPKLPQADIGKFFMDNTGKLYEALGKAGVKPAGPLCGIYYDWNTETRTTSMMICVPVAEKHNVPGLANDNIPAGKAYWTTMYGGPSGSYAAHTAVDEKFKADGMEMGGPALEEYEVNQGSEPDSTKWITKIIYMVKPKAKA